MILRLQAAPALVRKASRMATSQGVKEPLIAVMGTTGTGKSDLAVDLAVRFNGEIINADAMQMYKGLPIITNQISEEEKRGIPHHLLATIDYSEPTWTVDIFAQEAKKCIRDIRQRGKLPIVVGGTHYYINALLFESSLVREQNPEDDGPSKHRPQEETSIQFPILDAPTDKILQRLREVDPVMADRWHPGERRKIRRSLEIFLTTGKRASDIYAQQQEEKAKARLSSSLSQTAATTAAVQEGGGRPWDTLMFWVYSKPDILKERLDKRVDKMVQRGLMDEVKVLYSYLLSKSAAGEAVDRTRGIWQSIGFKQLEPFLDAERKRGGDAATTDAEAVERGGAVEKEEKEDEGSKRGEKENKKKKKKNKEESELDKLKTKCYQDIQTATRQYAKSQLKWIRHKTIPPLKEHHRAFDEYFYLLDSSDAGNFSRSVLDPAASICSDFLLCSGNIKMKPPTQVSETAREVLSAYSGGDGGDRDQQGQQQQTRTKKPIQALHCEVCDSPILSDSWDNHVRGKKHKRAQRARSRMALVPVPAEEEKGEEEEEVGGGGGGGIIVEGG